MDGHECGLLGRWVAEQMRYQVGRRMGCQVGEPMSDGLSGSVGDPDQ